jgi:hypothetical protein
MRGGVSFTPRSFNPLMKSLHCPLDRKGWLYARADLDAVEKEKSVSLL